MDRGFWKSRKVFITGHTGFKGAWLARMLVNAGAEVTGYALAPEGGDNLFGLSEVEKRMVHHVGDVRDFDSLYRAFEEAGGEIVFHLAAQPIVRESYRRPRETYETNLMGTVNLLECVRLGNSAKSVVVVTTDKVYSNCDGCEAFKDGDRLDGYDPYSNSKSCCELACASYRRSFLAARGVALSTVRAGNVIGGGDFAPDRIIPDCVRAVAAGEAIKVRNPGSVRPYQHVLEPLAIYMDLAHRQFLDGGIAGSYNVGPDEGDALTTGALVDEFCRRWGEGARWEMQQDAFSPHEAKTLMLDNSKIKAALGWKPRWSIGKAVGETCEFYRRWLAGGRMAEEMDREIEEFCDGRRI
jgi:CDP-glucose 4,6-dehydratase